MYFEYLQFTNNYLYIWRRTLSYIIHSKLIWYFPRNWHFRFLAFAHSWLNHSPIWCSFGVFPLTDDKTFCCATVSWSSTACCRERGKFSLSIPLSLSYTILIFDFFPSTLQYPVLRPCFDLVWAWELVRIFSLVPREENRGCNRWIYHGVRSSSPVMGSCHGSIMSSWMKNLVKI